MRAIVTGGAGFIGSAVVRKLVEAEHEVLVLDKLTYAGDKENIESVSDAGNFHFVKADICDEDAVKSSFSDFKPDTVFHLAAESHVDRSIDDPRAFIDTNLVGTFVMLEGALRWARGGNAVKFLHVSTDEVYGSLGETGLFTEETAYAPNSPYSASKAGADHLVRAWNKTYDLPVYISNCSNNYGPYQNAEKLIPTVIRNALLGNDIPIYGTGTNVRDWLYVDDHVLAMLTILERGTAGEKYNIGGNNEIRNIDIAQTICKILDVKRPKKSGSYSDQIVFVADRPGHDFRYAIDPQKVQTELGWQPSQTFESGIELTIDWYLDKQASVSNTTVPERLGLSRHA